MTKILNNEIVLCSINSHKEIKNHSVIINFISNLFGPVGRITNDFKLILTIENLYIEAINYAAWGGLPETAYKEKISLNDIKSFDVKNEGDEEFICLTTFTSKKIAFIRDNTEKNNLASEMANLIYKNK
jgi:hypothetical protein